MSKNQQSEPDGPTGVEQVDAYIDTRMTAAEQAALANAIRDGDVEAGLAIVEQAVEGKKR